MALEAKLSKAKRKGDCDHNELRRIMEDIEACRVPVRRHVVMDATLEKLQEIQRDNPRGLLLLRDELAGWLAGLTKAGHETDRGYYLEAWDGDKSSTVDRIGRGTIYVLANCLSLYGTIQPARLAPLVEGVANGTGDDGLLQRLQLLVFVDTLPPWAAAPAAGDTSARDRVTQIFETIDGALSADDPKVMCFDAEAQAILNEWRGVLEHRIRQGDLRENPIKCGHLSKYRSLMPSLAAIFHLVGEVAAYRCPNAPGLEAAP